MKVLKIDKVHLHVFYYGKVYCEILWGKFQQKMYGGVGRHFLIKSTIDLHHIKSHTLSKYEKLSCYFVLTQLVMLQGENVNLQ